MIDGPVTLENLGAVTLNGSASVITGAGNPTDVLINDGNAISGTGTIEDLVLNNNSGTIEALGGTLTIDTGNTVINDDIFVANLATLDIMDAVGGIGSGTIGTDAILVFQSSVSATQTVVFTDSSGALRTCDAADFHASIDGLVPGDSIDLMNVAPLHHCLGDN